MAVSPSDVVADLCATLAACGTRARADHERVYLKSELEFLGAPVPAIRRTARAWRREHPNLPRAQLWRIVEALWRTRVHECWQVGTALLELAAADLGPADLPKIERLLRRSQSWAHIDWLATTVAAPAVWRSAHPRRQLHRWARDGNFWVRRAAILCFIPRLRVHSEALPDLLELVGPMLVEREFFIRKAIGWVLRSASKTQPRPIAAFVERRLSTMSGVTFREAVKYLADRDRERLSRAFREGRGKPRAAGTSATRRRAATRAAHSSSG